MVVCIIAASATGFENKRFAKVCYNEVLCQHNNLFVIYLTKKQG